jgi:hypothetical protein
MFIDKKERIYITFDQLEKIVFSTMYHANEDREVFKLVTEFRGKSLNLYFKRYEEKDYKCQFGSVYKIKDWDANFVIIEDNDFLQALNCWCIDDYFDDDLYLSLSNKNMTTIGNYLANKYS